MSDEFGPAWEERGLQWFRSIVEACAKPSGRPSMAFRPCSCCGQLTPLLQSEDLKGTLLCSECRKKGPLIESPFTRDDVVADNRSK